MKPDSFETVIGLEIHAHLLTKSKLFCSCSTQYGAPPNTQTCPVCLGMPGALPVLNFQAFHLAVKFALAVKARIAPQSSFSRKNYFYPDLPKGYQITQVKSPLATGGALDISSSRRGKNIHFDRINIEEDAGKSLHDGKIDSFRYSRIDFNRSGLPLLEIVSLPEIESPEEAVEFTQILRQTLQYLDVCSGNMEEGSLRCDANLSVKNKGSDRLGVKVEIKNINSFRHLADALAYERRRQSEILRKDNRVLPETRFWDEKKKRTVLMRTKEEDDDYRYFPEPDLPRFPVTAKALRELRNNLTELPQHKRKRLVREYKIPLKEATVLTETKDLADFFEKTAASSQNPRAASRWILREVLRELKDSPTGIEGFPVFPQELGKLIKHVDEKRVTLRAAKETVFPKMIKSQKSASSIIKSEKLEKILDEKEITRIMKEIVFSHPRSLQEYQRGKSQVFDFFVGLFMEITRGRADPQTIKSVLKTILENRSNQKSARSSSESPCPEKRLKKPKEKN